MNLPPLWRIIAGTALLAAAYLLAARLGLALAFAQAQVSPIWPPTGLALAVLIRFGPRWWPGLFLGAFAANYLAAEPLLTAAGVAAGNTLEALAGAWLLRRRGGFRAGFERVGNVWAFIGYAALFAPVISATLGATSLAFGGVMPWSDFVPNWQTWWLGDALGALVVAPVLLTWSRAEPWPVRPHALAEGAALGLAVLGVAWFAFSQGTGFRFLVFPPLIWAALRFGPRGATLATLATVGIAVWHTVHLVVPFASESVSERLHSVQIFASVTALTILFLAAVKREREHAREQLRRHLDELEAQVVARTVEVENSRAQLQDILDNASDLIQSVDAAGRYGFVNRAWCEALGYTPEAAAGLTIFDVIAPEDHGHCREAFARLLVTGDPLRIETKFRAKDGRQVLVEGHVNLRAEAGRPATTRGVFRDITERKQAEQQMLANLAKEKELNELKSRFVAMASHELRTPLATFSLGVELLQMHWARLTPEQIERNLLTITTSVQHLRSILDDLLLLGQSEEGRLRCRPVAVELPGFCRKLTEETREADRSRHPFEWEFSGPAVETFLDPQLLRHILTNLLSNACKYSPEGRPVRCRIAAEADRIVLTVADEGIGIPPEDQPRLFDFFFRAGNVGGIPGTGLGLLVVQRCVTAHDGHIGFASAPGQGTCFTVTLPRASAPL